jgi:serine/threonine-protein kinase
LAKEPERRYPSAEALAADLRACLDGRPIAARGDSAMYRLRKFIRRNKVGVAAAVVVALALIAATGVSVWQAGIARAQAQRAETKSATAEAEKDFLLSVFSSANPYKTDGKTVTARDLLEGGLEQTATKLAGQPQVQAEIYTSFVETFVQLDQIPLAERSANLARDAYAKFLPDDAVEVLRAEQLQDQVQLWATHMDGLAPRIENLLARIGERGGEYAELRGAVLQMLTSTYYRSGQLDQAARIGYQTIAQQRSLHAQYHYDVGLALYQLALIRLAQGRPADTAVLIGELAPGDRTLVGPEHPGLMTDVTIIGRYFNAVGRLPEAQELLAAALAARRRQFPETHNFVLRTRALLAAAQLDAGNADAVEATLAAIIATAEALPDAAVDDLAEMHCDRGRALVALGRYDEAQRELDAAHALILRQTDATARVPLAIEAAVADLTRRHGDAAAARADLGRIAQQQRQRDDRELPATLLALARALKASGATVQATGAPLREAAEVLRRKGSSTQGLAREIEIELAQLTSGEEAFTHWQHAAEIGCLNFGCDDARTQQLVQHAAAAKGVPKAEVVARLAQSDGVRNPPGQTLYITARDILDKAAAARAADAAKNGSAPP